jgi:hypothetical protein
MKSLIFLNIVTRKSLVSVDEGITFFGGLAEHGGVLLPERYGNSEPLKGRLQTGGDLGSLLLAWEFPFLWTAHRAKVTGSVWHGISPPPSQGTIKVSVDRNLITEVQTLALTTSLCSSFLADFALIQLLTPLECERGSQRDVVSFADRAGTKDPILFLPAIKLRTKYVPDLYWLTLFGPPYVKIFGRERLLSAPVYRVEELPYGGVSLQLTPSLTDLTTNPEEFEETRRAVLDHLNCDVFLDPTKAENYNYRRPDFLNREGEPEVS